MKRILLTLPAVLAAALALALGSSGNPTTAPASIVVVGDSITSGITSPIAWPSLLTIWHEVPVYNQGVPSNQTSQMLARFSDVLATGGQEVVIMGGTNDCYYDHDPATAVANIDAMVTQAKAAGRTVLLVGPIPRDQTDSLGGSMQPCLLTLRADLDAYAASHGAVTFADPWKRFGGSHINRSLYEDLGGIWVHPDAHGAFVLARVVADAMGWRFKGD